MKDLINFLSNIGLHYSESELTKLQELNLRGSRLATLPESISKLTNLQELDLSGNQLTELPESIDKLYKQVE